MGPASRCKAALSCANKETVPIKLPSVRAAPAPTQRWSLQRKLRPCKTKHDGRGRRVMSVPTSQVRPGPFPLITPTCWNLQKDRKLTSYNNLPRVWTIKSPARLNLEAGAPPSSRLPCAIVPSITRLACADPPVAGANPSISYPAFQKLLTLATDEFVLLLNP